MQQYGFEKALLFFFVLLPIFMLVGCTKKDAQTISKLNLFEDLYTDKGRYNPGEVVQVTVNLRNTTEEVQKGKVYLNLNYFNQGVLEIDPLEVTIEKGERENLTFSFTAPETDFKGYLLEAEFVKENAVVDHYTSAVDVSSDWSKFPRYGYLVNYAEKSQAEIDLILNNLTKHHINGLQFYDWQYKHQLPVKYDENGNIASEWLELSNRPVSSSTVQKYIDTAHAKNMMAMNYNLVFGTYDNPEEDGVNLDWGMYTKSDGTDIDFHGLPSNWQTSRLLLMDPGNEAWQDFIFEQEKKAILDFNFDGWHMDQLGARGDRYTIDGQSIDLIPSFIELIKNAKNDLDTRLVFNAVDEYGQDALAEDAPVDFLYTEVWTAKTYHALQRIIKAGFDRSENEKAMILAAYMNYGKRDTKGFFNTHSVLLTDAVIFASGGAHLELGDTGMLSSEYFPSNNLAMSSDLKSRMRNYYDFLVAYQNFLRDDITDIKSTVELEDLTTSRIGNSNSVWYFAKQKGNYELLHLINLLNNENDWRDDEQDKNAPEIKENVNVKYYTEKDVKNVFIASPDNDTIMPIAIDYTMESDDKGNYLSFTLPRLEYWDMVVIETK